MKIEEDWRKFIPNTTEPRGVDQGQPLSRGSSKGGVKKQAARLIRETAAPALNWVARATDPAFNGTTTDDLTGDATQSNCSAAPSPSSRSGPRKRRGKGSSASSGLN